jgi:hypothetical protein
VRGRKGDFEVIKEKGNRDTRAGMMLLGLEDRKEGRITHYINTRIPTPDTPHTTKCIFDMRR